MTAENRVSGARLGALTVGEAMRPGVVTCPPDASLPTMAASMVTHGIHAIVVSRPGSETPLIVTDLEFVRAVLEQLHDTRAAAVAREPIAMLSTAATLDDAIETMAVRAVAHVLAIDAGSGSPAGVLSTLDVAAVVGGVEPHLARMLRPAPARPASSARTLRGASIGAVMHHGVTTCAPDASLTTVARSMADHRVHCIAVSGVDVTSGGDQHFTWALIDDLSLVRAVHRQDTSVRAAAIAEPAPPAVHESDTLDHAAALMISHGTSHVVVIGRSGLPSGMVSTLDIALVVSTNA
jgi:CBS domain-containing protein